MSLKPAFRRLQRQFFPGPERAGLCRIHFNTTDGGTFSLQSALVFRLARSAKELTCVKYTTVPAKIKINRGSNSKTPVDVLTCNLSASCWSVAAWASNQKVRACASTQEQDRQNLTHLIPLFSQKPKRLLRQFGRGSAARFLRVRFTTTLNGATTLSRRDTGTILSWMRTQC